MKYCLILVFSILCFVGCGEGSLKETDIRRLFLQENPTAEIVSVEPGEGDGDDVYMHIRFKSMGSNAVQENVWLYQRRKKGWKRTWTHS
jgi:hypothetical protein